MSDVPAQMSAEPPAEPRVLELRVHGVLNTSPPDLLDLPPSAVHLVAGDKLGSFWEPIPDAAGGLPPEGARGHVPPGIRREAYSWGGMVRTVPDFGASGAAGIVLGVLARVFYALVLPFALGNAVVWTRVLSADVEVGRRHVASGVTAGLGRLFCLVLTLLFTTTIATLALDLGAAQCAVDAERCGPARDVFALMSDWTPGQRLAVLALVPVAAVGVLWGVSMLSQLRYDVLPGMPAHTTDLVSGETAPAGAVLAHPGFWSNRINRYLARIHLAAGIALTTLFVGLQGSLGRHGDCELPARVLGCAQDSWNDDLARVWIVTAAVALVLLVLAAALVAVLPTMRILTEEGIRAAWPNRASGWLLLVTTAVFALTLAVLALGPSAAAAVDDAAGAAGAAGASLVQAAAETVTATATRQYGAGMAPVVLVIAGLVIALSGLVWRPRTADTAWSGRAPAVFMILALAVATAMSAIVVVTVGDVLNGSRGPASLIGLDAAAPGTTDEGAGRVQVEWTDGDVAGSLRIGAPVPDPGALEVSRSFVALGVLLVAAAVVVLVIIGIVALQRRDVNARAQLWRRPFPVPRRGALPPTGPDDIVVGTGGVLPPSPANLFQRIADERSSAARLHIVEPAVGIVAAAFGLALIVGVAWTLVSYQSDRGLWPWFLPPEQVERAVDVLMTVLAWSGVILVGLLALGGAAGAPRPLGIVWDIACALPRTAHPFGPPCYAERAVPEIAGRLNDWLNQGRDRRAILAAHSMGAVLSMAAIGLLASAADTRDRLSRIAVLTFGVQLRPFFGRMLPELLGPDVLGTHPSRSPRLTGDPWRADVEAERTRTAAASDAAWTTATRAAPDPTGRIAGTLVPATSLVRWISLWRLTDYLGYPALSTRPDGTGWVNRVDRCASELDTSGYMVEVGTHSGYYRTPEYTHAVEQLRDLLLADQ